VDKTVVNIFMIEEFHIHYNWSATVREFNNNTKKYNAFMKTQKNSVLQSSVPCLFILQCLDTPRNNN